MRRQVTVRLSEELAAGIDRWAELTGRTKSEIVRTALSAAGLAIGRERGPDPRLLERAAALRARQPQTTDAVALLREIRTGSQLRLTLRRLTVPFMRADLT